MANVDYITVFILTLFLLSCEKPEEVSPLPQIEFVSVSKVLVSERYQEIVNNQLQSIEDTSIVKISFVDGDGDLGVIENDFSVNKVFIEKGGINVLPDSVLTPDFLADVSNYDSILANIFLIDNRTGFVTPYPMPDVLPDGNNKVVRGEVELTLTSFGCINGINDTDFVDYQIFIKDRSGNSSDTIAISSIGIICR